MMKEEFETRYGEEVTLEAYEIIEKEYLDSPCLDVAEFIPYARKHRLVAKANKLALIEMSEKIENLRRCLHGCMTNAKREMTRLSEKDYARSDWLRHNACFELANDIMKSFC